MRVDDSLINVKHVGGTNVKQTLLNLGNNLDLSRYLQMHAIIITPCYIHTFHVNLDYVRLLYGI